MTQTDYLDRVRLAEVVPPELDADVPVMLTDETITERKQKILCRMDEEGIDTLVIYDDLEHGKNFEYLTGFVTRFEEGLFVLQADGSAALVLGNENLKMAEHSRVPANLIHTPLFSLPNQPMAGDRPLVDVLREAGVEPGKRVGVVGWKMFTSELRDNLQTYDVPAYIVDAIREIVGARMLNAAYILIGDGGARTTNNANEIARYEYGQALASDCVLRTMDRLEPGMSELELGDTMVAAGQPTNIVTVAATGERYQDANFYPLDKHVEIGDRLSLSVGYKGGCASRSCFTVAEASELPPDQASWLDEVARPYFASVVAWLENIHVGMPGGELHALIEEVLPRATYGWTLCPGHLAADEEWMSSPIYEGSVEPIRSGQIFQIDIIPSMKGLAGVGCENGVALADATLRERIREEYPEMAARFDARRRFMVEQLGIELNEDVLLLSSGVAYLRPFALAKGMALVAQH